jgi:hypothetical protein
VTSASGEELQRVLQGLDRTGLVSWLEQVLQEQLFPATLVALNTGRWRGLSFLGFVLSCTAKDLSAQLEDKFLFDSSQSCALAMILRQLDNTQGPQKAFGMVNGSSLC